MNIKYVLGTVTIIAIVGGTIYAIKKSKDLEKAEGEVITLEEARHIVAVKETHDRQSERLKTSYNKNVDMNELASQREEEMYEASEDWNEMVDDIRDVASYNRSYMPNAATPESEAYGRVIKGLKYDTYSPDIDQEFEEEDEEKEEVQYEPEIEYHKIERTGEEGEEVLRHDPNSFEALDQFKRMELAEWVPNEDTFQTMMYLFDFPFQPKNDGDEILLTQIIDYRVQFFGFNSKWVRHVSYADVILNYARKAQFNVNETVRFWTEYFLEFNNLFHAYASQAIDEEIESLNSHTYYNEERATFGLFGLTRESMDQAIRIANDNVDRSVTYEIEFNEFLKSCV